MDDCSFKSQDIGQLLLQFIQTHLREKKEGFNSFGRTTLFEINKTQERDRSFIVLYVVQIKGIEENNILQNPDRGTTTKI